MVTVLCTLAATLLAKSFRIDADGFFTIFSGSDDQKPDIWWDNNDPQPLEPTDGIPQNAQFQQASPQITKETKLPESEYFAADATTIIRYADPKSFRSPDSLNAAKEQGSPEIADFLKEETSSIGTDERMIKFNDQVPQRFTNYQNDDSNNYVVLGQLQTSHARRLGTPGYCTNSPSLLNLFNTAAYAEQSSFWPAPNASQSAVSGCDGDVIEIDTGNPPPNYNWVLTKLVHTNLRGTPITPQFWKVTLAQATPIKSTLLINRDDAVIDRFPEYTVTVGNNADVTLNPTCVARGAMTDGGWNLCPNSMIGTTFGFYSTTEYVNFMEAMAFSQEAIQMNAMLVSFLGIAPGFLVANISLKNIVVPNFSDPARRNCVLIAYDPETRQESQFSIKFKAEVPINGVVVIPGYIKSPQNLWISTQLNVAIYSKRVGGAKSLCGVLVNYYTKYGEVICNNEANEIILVQQTANQALRFCGFGALSDCECARSSFDPFMFTTPSTPFAAVTSLQVKKTDSQQSIKFNQQMPDTVSSVCGAADGFIKCGQRVISFKDKLSGQAITIWPYWGYSWNSASGVLTLDPMQANATSVLTATISLVNYPTTSYSQDITATVSPVYIPDMVLNATINQEAIIELDAQYSYVVTSKQTFEALIDRNLLKVLSTAETNAGTYYLELVATSQGIQVKLKVKITFSVKIDSVNPQKSIDSKEVLASSLDLGDQYDRVTCNADDVCLDPNNSRFSCQVSDANTPMVCGIDLVKKGEYSENKAITRIPPTMQVSLVSNQGILKFSFNQRMDFSSLTNTTEDTNQTSRELQENLERYNNILSNQHISLTIQPGLDQDSVKLQFEWYAVKITETEILIQILFKNPLFVSEYAPRNPDFLVIKLRPALLVKLKTILTQLTIVNPLQTFKRRLPKQLELGKITKSVEQAANSSKIAAQALVIGNSFLSLFLQGIMGSMFTMVHSFQMMMVYSYMAVSLPANVILVMTQMNIIAQFNYLPTEQILDSCFDFSESEVPPVSFQDMGVLSTRLIVYLGSFIIAIFIVCVQSILFLMLWPLKKKLKLAYRYHKMMKARYYWRGSIRLIIESFFDLCVGILISFSEPSFDKPSDIFDFTLTCLFSVIVIAAPIASLLLYCKYSQELHEDWFQKRFGSLTEGYHITGALGSASTVKMIIWYFVRRILTAVALVHLSNQSPVFQIAAILYISLADLLINFHLNAYESKLGGITAKINDLIVFLLSYFPILYAGLISDQDVIYKIGWAQCALVGVMFVANVLAVSKITTKQMMEESRRIRVENFNLRVLKDNGFVMVVERKSCWQTSTRLLAIDWVFFDRTPARLNQQIAPYVQMYMHQRAEYAADRADQLQVKFEVDAVVASQNEQKGKVLSNENGAQQNNEFSFRLDRSQLAVKDDGQKEYNSEPKKFDENGEETKQHKEWENQMLRPYKPSHLASKITATQDISRKVVPDQHVAPNQLYQGKRKLIVSDTRESVAREKLNKLKARIFDLMLQKLIADQDPIVGNSSRNLAAREVSFLLPNNINSFSDNELKDQVRTIIGVSGLAPELNNEDSQELDFHKEMIAQIEAKEKILFKALKINVEACEGMKTLAQHADEMAKTGSPKERAEAKINAFHIRQEEKECEAELGKKNAQARKFSEQKAYHDTEIKRLCKQKEIRM